MSKRAYIKFRKYGIFATFWLEITAFGVMLKLSVPPFWGAQKVSENHLYLIGENVFCVIIL